MKRQSDRRAYQRLTGKQKVRVRVISAPDEPSLVGRTFAGATNDVSVGGVKFYARRPLPVGTTLAVDVELSRPREHFERAGSVIWSQQQASNSRVIVGVNFTDTTRDKVIPWRRMLARRC